MKEARSREAIAAAEEMNLTYRRSLIDSRQPVLFETEEDGFWSGHAPNYVRVFARGTELHNTIRNVRITGLHGEGVEGELEEKA